MIKKTKLVQMIIVLPLVLPLSACIGANIFCLNPCPKPDEIRDSFCNCNKRPGGTNNPIPPSNQNPYYMIARYSCVEVANPNNSAGTCDRIQYGSSCDAAKNGILQDVQARGDPCMYCAGITDPTKKWDGNPPEWIQGGLCTGQSELRTEPNSSLATSAAPPLCNIPTTGPAIPRSNAGAGPHEISLTFYSHEASDPKALQPGFNVPADASDVSCLPKCADGTSADCISSKLDSAKTVSVRKLYVLVSGPDKRSIEPKDLEELFGLQDDKCHRGPTKFSSSGVVNDGDECVISALSEEPKVLLRLSIPAHLEGTWLSRQSSLMRIRFTGKLPTVHFFTANGYRFHALDSDFGGQIVAVESDGHQIAVRTDNPGCVAVSF
jgi:hypothetical protein